MKGVAKLFSYLFHPVFMPLIGFVIIYNSGIYESGVHADIKKYSYLINALFSIFLPTTLMSFLLYFHQIKSLELTDRKERNLPLVFITISLFILYLFIRRFLPFRILQGFTLSTVVISMLLVLVTLKMKISMHMIGLGGITGLIIAISLIYNVNLLMLLAVTTMITGIVGSARMLLQAHESIELFLGYILGTLGTFSIVYYFTLQ